MRQLILDLLPEAPPTFDNFVAGSNEDALTGLAAWLATGAALASLVSRAVACAVVLYLLQKPACPLRVDGLRALAPDVVLIRRIESATEG